MPDAPSQAGAPAGRSVPRCSQRRAFGIAPVSARPVSAQAVTPRIVYVVRGRPGPDDRPPLPPGHPDTWGLITAGTCTEGTPYPFPVFLP